jgi:excisionase family DNA binding protein
MLVMEITHDKQLQHIAKESSIRSTPPKNLNVPEAADYIGISQRYLRSLIAERKIRVVRIGHRVLLRLIDVDRWLESKTEGGVL